MAWLAIMHSPPPQTHNTHLPEPGLGQSTHADKLTVIFVSFNSHAMLLRNLPSLCDEPNFRIVVIDNHSNDGTAAIIRQSFASVEVIEQTHNLGYGRAANVGLRLAQTRYALLLNPDVMATPAGIASLLAHTRSDSQQTAIWAPTTDMRDYAEGPPKSVDWVSGGVMLFDVEKVREIGLFDENIFLFAEETDLCERTLKTGYGIKLCTDVFFEHLAGQSCPPSEKTEYMRWWHFGWSQCYRMTKNGHRTIFRNPQMKYLGYLIHSFTARSRDKRTKWKAKSHGARAYIRGEKAFRPDGSPQFS